MPFSSSGNGDEKIKKKHQSQAGKELKIIVKTLKGSQKHDFFRRLHYWYLKHQDYLNERSEKCNEKDYFPYKHKGLSKKRKIMFIKDFLNKKSC
ncbi:hypothetical protein [Volucribacter psittacicida]|uniref:hypothetical protein n=1 Tax=Volucribacter psittacicida TaxID=203482 RepID=UPI0026D3A8CE